MKNKHIIILASITLFVTLFAFIFGPVERRDPEESSQTQKLFPQLNRYKDGDSPQIKIAAITSAISDIHEIFISRSVKSETAKKIAGKTESLHVDEKTEKTLILSRKDLTGWVVASRHIGRGIHSGPPSAPRPAERCSAPAAHRARTFPARCLQAPLSPG